MRTYRVTGMTCGGCENAVKRAVREQLGEATMVEADAQKGEVRVDASADPQIVVFAVDSAGYRVDKVEG